MRMKLLLIALLILTACTGEKKQTTGTKELVGIWQAIPEMASGWADTYQFFDNGDFVFHYNQMICDKRTIDYSGTWELIGTDKLKLTIKARTILVGGKLVPATGSCGSDYEIEGGEIKNVELDEPEVQAIQLSTAAIDKENRDLTTRAFAEKPFWRVDDDPAGYQ
jgi:hypothetical protein